MYFYSPSRETRSVGRVRLCWMSSHLQYVFLGFYRKHQIETLTECEVSVEHQQEFIFRIFLQKTALISLFHITHSRFIALNRQGWDSHQDSLFNRTEVRHGCSGLHVLDDVFLFYQFIRNFPGYVFIRPATKQLLCDGGQHQWEDIVGAACWMQLMLQRSICRSRQLHFYSK